MSIDRKPTTAALNLSADRGERIGNPKGAPEGMAIEYLLPGGLKDDLLYLEGPWRRFSDRLTFSGPGGGAIYIRYTAKEVCLVMSSEEEAVIWINHDRRKMRREELGPDGMIDDKGRAWVRVTAHRNYRLIRNPGAEQHELRLFTQARGLSLYAFTFDSGDSGTDSPQ
ncbi:MAG: hypothetical protein HY282_18645 [Nitrospirae bacterium]|nr:hypothetical protein [Candidatus Manganitrophaceae bacterium]